MQAWINTDIGTIDVRIYCSTTECGASTLEVDTAQYAIGMYAGWNHEGKYMTLHAYDDVNGMGGCATYPPWPCFQQVGCDGIDTELSVWDSCAYVNSAYGGTVTLAKV